jgi:hypothetical protein
MEAFIPIYGIPINFAWSVYYERRMTAARRRNLHRTPAVASASRLGWIGLRPRPRPDARADAGGMGAGRPGQSASRRLYGPHARLFALVDIFQPTHPAVRQRAYFGH